MLPSIHLDDRRFEEIVEKSKASISRLAPEWSDLGHHDPGIAMIEMLSWLMEMQQYYLNQVTEKNERKFLKLMGIVPQQQACAKTDVTFDGVTDASLLPEGTRMFADKLPFETEEPLVLVPARLEKILVQTERETTDVTSSNGHQGVTYYAFGQQANAGSRIYLGFDQPLPTSHKVPLGLRLFENYPVKVTRVESESLFVPSARVAWEYYGAGASPSGTGWHQLPVVRDETMHFSFSGRVHVELPHEMKPLLLYPANDKPRFWICCTVVQGGFELSPRLEEIELNSVRAVQRETLSNVCEFDGTGLPGQRIAVSGYLPYYGSIEVQVRGAYGWELWREEPESNGAKPSSAQNGSYRLWRDSLHKAAIIDFGDQDVTGIPPKGSKNIRVIACRDDFARQRLVGESSGLPDQSFRLGVKHILRESLHVQVARKVEGLPEPVWEDWELIDDFDASTSFDRHYLLRQEDGDFLILFGNNEHGAIPERIEGFPGIRILSCQTGGGVEGNIQGGQINRFHSSDAHLSEVLVTNPAPAAGGRKLETTEEAKHRLRKQRNMPDRAVTAADYEQIALRTPGVRIARAKAIPLYKAGMADYPRQKAAAQMTVVVVPYTDRPTPMPSDGFLETVRRHLERRRLLATEVHVVPPAYIKITVYATVVVEPALLEKKQAMRDALRHFLQPLDIRGHEQMSGEGRGWDFGRPVYKCDLFELLNRMEGVHFVKDLWISAEGAGITRDEEGDIRIPPHGLVYSGDHVLELIGAKGR
ncbi:putative baseplate assembly protein [Brevibacillus borstelensis]|uniref:putative baseplate assembly protein n=1 Tax=Brevibacillus borstelensis TaxID=45462 RepID=UPI0030C4A9CA